MTSYEEHQQQLQANTYENNVEMSSVSDQNVDAHKLLNEQINQNQPFYLMRSTPRTYSCFIRILKFLKLGQGLCVSFEAE